MKRLTDEQLGELERVAQYNVGRRTLRCMCDMMPALLAELRALRKVREAAERYREDMYNYRERDALFVALDEAGGEQC